MHSLDSLSVLLPGKGPKSRDRYPVADCGFRAWLAHIVVPAVRWAI